MLYLISCIGHLSGSGKIESLQWLRAQDPPCPWDAAACRAAVESGHLEALQWLRAQDPPCPWDYTACNEAADSGNLVELQWLRAQTPPCPWNLGDILWNARYSRGDVKEWLHAYMVAQHPDWTWKGAFVYEDGTPYGGNSDSSV
jgi:hypothetical protein